MKTRTRIILEWIAWIVVLFLFVATPSITALWPAIDGPWFAIVPGSLFVLLVMASREPGRQKSGHENPERDCHCDGRGGALSCARHARVVRSDCHFLHGRIRAVDVAKEALTPLAANAVRCAAHGAASPAAAWRAARSFRQSSRPPPIQTARLNQTDPLPLIAVSPCLAFIPTACDGRLDVADLVRSCVGGAT